ncbi:hypothetical protein [Okeania sp.]|uniref:hypothetical protein n=1 Tax=Okeania sp. TaxID=3100323 RepID=UPI002B4B8004|nr:hypothetical protein [Okeania sp.]MEB3342609.1 hypothetical protein [Okeania sp.]
MNECIVIVESKADARTATKLGDRLLLEKVDWLEEEQLQDFFQWSGLEENIEYSCWKDIKRIIENSGVKIPKTRGAKGADGAAAKKILKFVSCLQKTRQRQIKAVVFIRDLDDQPERKESIEKVRSEYSDRQFKIVMGMANRNREAWVLNGFIPLDKSEAKILEEIKSELKFDPCEESHRLCSNSKEETKRMRNPKIVLEKLTRGEFERERKCWEETSLETLQKRGVSTGLTDYMNEVENQLTSIIFHC